MTTYLKATDESALYAALEAAGLVTPDADAVIEGRAGYRHNVFMTVVGVIARRIGGTDDAPVMETLDGYHANIYAPITDEQRAMLPVIAAPANPVRVAAA